MRLRLPRELPTYLLLALVIAFVVASAWLGVTRLDTLVDLDEATARGAETAHSLQALRNAVSDIEIAGRGYVLTGNASDRELYDRARRAIPPLLASVRDRVRDNPEELALVESLVPLIARRTALTGAAIEAHGSNSLAPDARILGGDETTESIRAIIAKLDAGEQEEIARDRGTLAASMGAARRDRYLLSSVTVLCAFLLVMAVQRLKSFMPPEPRGAPIGATASAPTNDDRIALLLYDAMLRARLALKTYAESEVGERFRDVLAAIEKARDAHGWLAAKPDSALSCGPELGPALAALAQRYQREGGPSLKTRADQTIAIADGDTCLLIYRAAEWALEAIVARKHSGEIALHFAAGQGEATLRIVALPDKPDLPLLLSPDEDEDAAVLKDAAEALGGRFVATRGVTGLSLLLAVPLRG
jgi:CHASE3 domain sensor protein